MLYVPYARVCVADDLRCAVLSQMASGPLTVAHALRKTGGDITEHLVLHLIGAEMRYEGSCPYAWEYFFLHAVPQVRTLHVVMIGPELGGEDAIEEVPLCDACTRRGRRLRVEFVRGLLYHEYTSTARAHIVCAFNPGLHRATGYAGLDTWPETIRAAASVPGRRFVVTAYTKHEAPLDLRRVLACCQVKPRVALSPQRNPYASLKPDRNFISDHEAPLIYKNYYLTVLVC